MFKPKAAATRLLLLVVLTGCATACNRNTSTPAAANGTARESAAAPTTSTKKAIPELTLREVKITRDQDGKLVAKGEVTNTATRPLTKVEATLKIYDEKGVEIATLKPTVDQLPPLYSWNFAISVQQANAVKASVTEFTGE